MTPSAPLFLSLAIFGSVVTLRGQGPDDPQLHAAVLQFFAMQEAEDVEGYLRLWSSSAQKPQPAQLQFVFQSGDDKYSEVAIVSVRRSGDRARVRVAATRDRTSASRIPGAVPRTFRSTTEWGLVYVREDEEWKLLREGSVADALAESLLELKTQEERSALLAEEPELLNDALVVALARRAGQFTAMQAYPPAQAAYELMADLARRIGHARLEGEALQNIANAMYFQRNYAGALQAYEKRLAIERTREDQEGIAAALVGIATIRYTFAEYGPALSAYEEALTLQEKFSEPRLAMATTLISTGNIKYLQGDYPTAIADYAHSRDINKSAGNASGEADALEGMARVFIAQGDYAAALDALAGVLAEARTANNRNDQASALTSLGDVHFRLGNFDTARSSLDEARGHFEATKNLAGAGRAWQSLALVDLAAARFVLAEEEYRKSAAICSSAADDEGAAAATVGLAFAQAAQEKFSDSIATYKTAIEAFTTLNRLEQAARARLGLARAYLAGDQPEAALETARQARRAAEDLTNDDVLWRALVAEAGALRKIGQRSPALSAAESAVTAVTRLVEAAKVWPSAPVARDTPAAFAMLALLQAEAGDGMSAFESVERMRVHDLRSVLARGERDISRGMTDAERDEERAIAVELVSLHAQLTREKAFAKPDAGRLARLEKRIAEASQTRIAQQQKLFERLPHLRHWRGLSPPAGRAELLSVIPDPGTGLVQFVVGDDALLVLLAKRTNTGVQISSLFEKVSRKTLAERVAKLLAPETMRDPAAWRLAGRELIPGFAATLSGLTRAIVIPHEILWRVPFEALPSDDGYLDEHLQVAYATSATALVPPPASETRGASPGPDLLAVSAPALPQTALEKLAQIAPEWEVRPAANAAAEIKAVATAAEGAEAAVIDSASATEANLRSQMPSAAVIHLASPFRINGASPLFSSVLTAPDPGHDAALEAREVMNLELRARVVLFSDGSAMSMRDAADETGVIAWAWRAAGVPALVVPRWRVDDLVATPFLVSLHQRLRAGETPGRALRAARLEVRSKSRTAAPYFWAGWMVVGQ